MSPDRLDAGHEFALETAKVLRRAAATTGGVILGRAAAVVLEGEPGVLHARLTGTVEARRLQAQRLDACDAATATSRQQGIDAARTSYVQLLHGRDPDDPALYHLILDSTRLTLDACVELLTDAAKGLRWPA